ncbi:Fic family protein [Paraburkholderia unamae]|uniref:Fic family protein n=1 Tax=Paraburkholderia unamae TaxID=219649 RepID=UPI000DC2E4CC|nr:Fic family protein [Paraburkholderia unamae]RAR58828.1 Fic family protein [Paraburkholderia unamae]
MMPLARRYPYEHPHQMQPLMPGEHRLESLRPLAARLIAQSAALAAHGMPRLRAALREALRPMNSYYTNKIEGQHTEPLLIEQALQRDFSSKPDEARRQRIAIAHIETERWSEAAWPSFDSEVHFGAPVVRDIHRHLHEQLRPDDLRQEDDDGKLANVLAGEWRAQGVQVGRHVPPDPAAIPAFMDAWQTGYRHARAGETAVIALAAAHHRLAWIHPFLDGNGRVARLHTHIGLAALGLTHGLWSPMRGFARSQPRYYASLAEADQPRKGDLDGRGNLTEAGLVSFIEYFLEVCLDQIGFMQGMLDLSAFESRLAQMLAALAQTPETRYLRAEAALPLAMLGTVESMDRARFKAMTGLAARTADRLLADLFKIGILGSPSPRGPIELALPIALFRWLFPRLWPEAESAGT